MRRSEEPIGPGILACWAMSLAFVFLYREEVHTTTVIVLTWLRDGIKPTLAGWQHQFTTWMETPPTFTFVKAIVVLVGLLIGLVFLAFVIVIGLPLLIAIELLGWMGVNVDALFLFSFDVILGFAAGTALYGLVLPLLWRLLEPLLAFTVGELVYQRAKARMGLPTRYDQPAFLIAAFVCLGFAGLRLAFPVVSEARANWQAAARELYPATPTPNPWPRRFSVAPKEILNTGIVVDNQNLEFFVHPSRHVFVSLRKVKKLKGSPEFFERGRRPQADATRFAGWTGELVFKGADERTEILVWEPTYHGRRWLQPGDKYPTDIWVGDGEGFRFCGGPYLSFRTVSRAGASGWRDLSDGYPGDDLFDVPCKDSEPVARGGKVEFKARRRTWVLDEPAVVRPYTKELFVQVPAQRELSVELRIRPGDKVRVKSITEPVYWVVPREGEELIPRGYIRDRTLNYTGQIRLKGGVVGGRASVLLLARGPNWK